MFRNLFALTATLAMLVTGIEAHAACTAAYTNASLAESTPSSAFTDHGDGTVTHALTGLMWKQCAQGQSGAGCATGSASALAWSAALAAAAADTTAGYNDWRLPNKKELESIVERCGYKPAINQTLFPSTPFTLPSKFWSGSSYVLLPTNAWNVGFYDGYTYADVKTNGYYARLVRGGQPLDSFYTQNTGTLTIVKDAQANDPQDFHFTTSGTGLSAFDLDDDGDNTNTLSNTKTFSNLAAGSYSVAEVAASGWNLASIVCTPSGGAATNLATGAATINLAAGDNVTCTYTNTKQPTGTITIVKDAQPNDPQDFHFTAVGTGLSDFDLDDDGDNANTLSNTKTFPNLAAGSYSVAEVAMSGWTTSGTGSQGIISCSQAGAAPAAFTSTTNSVTVNLVAGSSVICTFINTKQATGKICGTKFNDMNGNGLKDAGDLGIPNWQISLGVAAIPAVMTDASGNYCFNNLPAATYTVSETPQAPWQQTYPSSPGTHTVTLTEGQSVADINFGNKVPASSCSSFSNGSFDSEQLVSAGSYQFINQALISAWDTTEADHLIEVWGSGFGGVSAFSGNQFIELNANTGATVYQNFTATPGSTVTVSYAHRGRPGFPNKMTVSIEPVTPDNNNLSHSFPVDTGVTTGWTLHSVTHTFPNISTTAYVLKFTSGDTSSGAGDTSAGGNFLDAVDVVCSAPPTTGTITIVKDAQPNDAQDFHFTAVGAGLSAFDLDDDGDNTNTLSNTKTFSNLAAGSYSVAEVAMSGWNLASIVCTPSGGAATNLATGEATINLAAGDNVTCTYTNTKQPTGTLTIVKDAQPNDPQDFHFTAVGAGLSAFDLDDDGDNTNTLSNTKTFSNLAAGSYSVAEVATSGWTTSGTGAQGAISCSQTGIVAGIPLTGPPAFTSTANSVTVNLVDGANVTCTFINTKQPVCVAPPAGMDHWYPLGENTGTAITDIIGARNGSTLPGAIGGTGPSPVSGKVGSALSFDGSSQYVEVPDASGILSYGNSTDNFSIDAWIKVNPADSSGVRPIVEKRLNIGGSVSGYSFYLNNGLLSFQLADGSVANSTCGGATSATTSCTNYGSTANVADGQFHLVVATIQRTGATPQLTLYVDGVVVYTATARLNGNNNAALLIGSGYPIVIPKPYFKGVIDELEIFNRVLTQAEIQSLYNAGSAGKCLPPPPTTGTITIVKDAQPNDPEDFYFTSSGTGLSAFDLDDDGDNTNTLSNTKTFSNLAAGSYSVAEVAMSGWNLASIVCTPSGGATTNITTGEAAINLAAGDNVICTFTNTKQPTGTLTIVKDAQPNDPQDFHFTTSGTGLNAFDLDDDGDNTNTLSNTKTFTNLTAGSYSVAEIAVSGWNLASIVCTPPGGVTTNLATGRAFINLAAGDNVACTFSNTKLPANSYTLTYIPGTGGSIAGSSPQTVSNGGNGSAVTAVPATGYHFVNWSGGSTANPRTDTNVTANVTVTANFASNSTLNNCTSNNATVSNCQEILPPSGQPSTFNPQRAVSVGLTGVNGTANICITFSNPPTNNLAFFKNVNGNWKHLYPGSPPSGISNVTYSNGQICFDILDNSAADENPATGTIADPVVIGTMPATGQTPISDDRVFAYAEGNYRSIFTAPGTAGRYQQYNYRYYPVNQSYLAIDTAGEIYMLGLFTGNAITDIGPVESFRQFIIDWEATVPVSDARVFAFAEASYPGIFTVPATPGQDQQYNYRYYPASGNYLAIDTLGVISIWGTYTGGAVTVVGPVESFRSNITGWEAAQ